MKILAPQIHWFNQILLEGEQIVPTKAYILLEDTKIKNKGSTASAPYKQMANFGGIHKSNPTSQTISQLVDPQSYIGTLSFTSSSQIKISEVELSIKIYFRTS